MRERGIWLTMNDGVRLDASICTPDGAVPGEGWPTVILVHGHGDAGSKARTLPRGRRLAERGYQVLCYSVRGQGGSEGLSFHLGARELFDLLAVIDHCLERLPVHKLAVAGRSQGGWHAWMAAAFHPRVDAVVPEDIFAHYDDFAVYNGALTRWFFTRTMRRRVMTAGLQYTARRWAIEGEWDRLREWLRPQSPGLFVDRVRCPVLVVHGWHDAGMPAGGVIAAYEALRGPKMLYLGGGGHEGEDADAAAAVREALIDRWLEHWLKGIDTGLMCEPPVRYARRPGWEHVAASGLDAREERTLYFRADGRLTRSAPDRPEANASVHNVPIDPSYTLETAIHRDMAGTEQALAHEVVRYEGTPASEALDILGSPRFHLAVLPNRRFFQIHAQLWDIAPDGGEQLISRGHQGTRCATPGRHLSLSIEARPIAWRLAVGHRLQVRICNMDPAVVFPIYRPWSARLYHELDRPSSITIPLG